MSMPLEWELSLFHKITLGPMMEECLVNSLSRAVRLIALRS
jgi:hypothetical protein